MVDQQLLETLMFSHKACSSHSSVECWKEDFFLHTVAIELSSEDLLRHSLDEKSQFFSLFKDKLFFKKLCEKWNLEKVATFEDFLLAWDSQYLFSENTSLEYQLERYKLTHSTSRAVRKAAFNGKDSFYNIFLAKYPDNDRVLSSVFRGRLKRKDGQVSYCNVKSGKRHTIRWYALRYGYSFEEVYPGQKREECTGYIYYDLAVADIAFGREVVFDDVVHINDIANFLKDASVLENPKYLNHPKVNPRRDVNSIIQSPCHQLLRTVEAKDILHCQYFNLFKKTYQLFEEKEFWKVCNVFVRDAYSYAWLKDFLNRYGYDPLKLRKNDESITILLTLENGVAGCCVQKTYCDPEFYELLESDLRKQEASVTN